MNTVQAATARWRENYFKDIQSRVRAALARSTELPEDIPCIPGEGGSQSGQLLDLRGIDLSALTIGALDLSYCCFDTANFSDSVLTGTHLQHSSFLNTKFDRSTWRFVQASPIDAAGASFHGADIRSSFFMRSRLKNATFDGATIHDVAFSGAELDLGKLQAAHLLVDVDIVGVWDRTLINPRRC